MTRDEFVRHLETRANDADRLGTLAAVAAVLRDVRALLEDVDGWPATNPADDHLITLADAAGRLGVTTRWLREHRPPYLVELGDRTFRVSERKLGRWLTRELSTT